MGIMKRKAMRAGAAAMSALIAAAALPSMAGISAGALVTDPAGDYDNFAKALQYSLYFYDGNMCGPDVEANNRFKWRANCHVYDAAVPLQPMDDEKVGTNLSAEFIKKYYDILNTGTEAGTVDVSGGFHDAGDHVKFGLPEAYAGTTVSWGYLEFRDAYVETEQAEHTETIIRYFCDYFMRSTFRDENGDVVCFCYQVGDGNIDHAYWQLPQNDRMARPAWFATPDNPTTCNVTNTAACLAINYLNFKESDPDYADKCLDYALALYNFADKNEKVKADPVQGPSPFYDSSKWEDDYCFASCWLYKITGEKKYIDNMMPYYDFYAPPGYVYCWNDMWNGVGILMAQIAETYKSDKTYTEAENPNGQSDLAMDYIYLNEKSPYEDINFWAMIAKALNGYMGGSPGTITPQGYFWLNTWGSCRYNTAVQFCALLYDKYNKGKDLYTPSHPDYYFSDWAKGQMEYILGNNEITALEDPNKTVGPRCFLVGFDESSAKYPHHRAASGLTKCEDTDQQLYVLFGALAGGPDADDCHNDVTEDWIYNEVTIDYNAACPGAAAGLYLMYKDKYKQAITPDFPPENDGGRGASGGGEGGEGGNATWVEACGIDDINADGAGVTKVSLMVKSNAAKAPENMTVRYYINISEIKDFSKVEASILYDQVSAEAAPNAASISAPMKWDKDKDYAYIEINWGDYIFSNSGKKCQFKVGFYYGDTWDPKNDWSYQDLKIYEVDDAFFGTGNEVRTDNICVYSDGVLIGGIEPDGTVPSGEGSVTTTTPEPTKPKVHRGDVDVNGEVELEDAVLLAKSVAGITGVSVTAQGRLNADCNDDGDVGSDDLTILLKYLAGSGDL